MTPEEKVQAAQLLAWGWAEKRDIERFTTFSREIVEKEFPNLIRAWDNYKDAERRMDLEIKALGTL